MVPRVFPKLAWPSLVGCDVARAAAVIRYGTPYSIEVHTYEIVRKAPLFQSSRQNCVHLYVDKDGYIATTPRVCDVIRDDVKMSV